MTTTIDTDIRSIPLENRSYGYGNHKIHLKHLLTRVYVQQRSAGEPLEEVDPFSPAGRLQLIRRRIALWNKGGVRRLGGCQDIMNFEQGRYGTCWFNAICNAVFCSDLGSKLMHCLYADWVLDIKSPMDGRKLPALGYLRLMVDLVDSSLFREQVPRSRIAHLPLRDLVKRLHLYSKARFENVGHRHGFSFDRSFLKNLICFAGVPKERICVVDVSKDLISKKLRRRLRAPVVLIIHVPSGSTHALLEPGNRRMEFEFERWRGRFDVDAVLTGDFNARHNKRHAIAGIHCQGARRLIDSATGRTLEFDWLDPSTPPTKRLMRGFEFGSFDYARTYIYYNVDALSGLHAASRRISDEWMSLYSGRGRLEPAFGVDIPVEKRNAWKNAWRLAMS